MTDFTMKDHYETKKECANNRGIDWTFSLEDFTVFWGLRNQVKCFYTNCNFKMARGSGEVPKLYPTAERICQSKPYSPSNCVWVTHNSNQIKSLYLEQGHSLQGVAPTIVKVVNKIKKVLSNPICMEEKLQPYKLAYKEVKVKNSDRIKQQNEEKRIKEEQEAESLKWVREKEIMTQYLAIIEEYEAVGVQVKISVGNIKKKFNQVADQITGVEFKEITDRWLFVIDKTKDITSDNVLVVHRDTLIAMNLLTKGADFSTISLNFHKLQNKLEK